MTSTGLNKGMSQEILAARYFQAHGYLVRTRVKLSVLADARDVTDIDLVGLRFGIPLAEERLICDCKNRRKPKPFERILWTKGLAQYSDADRSVVVLPQSPLEARQFASSGGIELISTSDLDVAASPIPAGFVPFGEASVGSSQYLSRLIANGDVSRQDLQLRQMLVAGHPITNLNRTIKILSDAGRYVSNRNTPDRSRHVYVCFSSAVLASVMLVRFAAECKWMPEKHWRAYAQSRLTFGDISPRKAQKLAELALLGMPRGSIPKPEYADEVVEMIGLLIANGRSAALLPYYLDMLLFGVRMGSMPADHQSPIIGEAQREIEVIGKQLLSTIAYASRVSPDIWEMALGPEPPRPAPTAAPAQSALFSDPVESPSNGPRHNEEQSAGNEPERRPDRED